VCVCMHTATQAHEHDLVALALGIVQLGNFDGRHLPQGLAAVARTWAAARVGRAACACARGGRASQRPWRTSADRSRRREEARAAHRRQAGLRLAPRLARICDTGGRSRRARSPAAALAPTCPRAWRTTRPSCGRPPQTPSGPPARRCPPPPRGGQRGVRARAGAARRAGRRRPWRRRASAGARRTRQTPRPRAGWRAPARRVRGRGGASCRGAQARTQTMSQKYFVGDERRFGKQGSFGPVVKISGDAPQRRRAIGARRGAGRGLGGGTKQGPDHVLRHAGPPVRAVPLRGAQAPPHFVPRLRAPRQPARLVGSNCARRQARGSVQLGRTLFGWPRARLT